MVRLKKFQFVVSVCVYKRVTSTRKTKQTCNKYARWTHLKILLTLQWKLWSWRLWNISGDLFDFWLLLFFLAFRRVFPPYHFNYFSSFTFGAGVALAKNRRIPISDWSLTFSFARRRYAFGGIPSTKTRLPQNLINVPQSDFFGSSIFANNLLLYWFHSKLFR